MDIYVETNDPAAQILPFADADEQGVGWQTADCNCKYQSLPDSQLVP